ncbi:MAG: tRNA lysidine(34) synthetase TilS [Bacilli bacterium]|nr:tRNA lysidine(34) synthetase TilS [Bacilli bacterium]
MNKVNDFLKNILKENDVVVIGCSGGPDSMALMHILMNFRKNMNLSLICAHVNHKIRVESDKEMEWLQDFCEKNDIIFEGMCINNYGDDNFHNEARNIRYNFFESLVEKYSAKYLMTAHHGDDLIETVLMRIVRGSTLNGYSGFKKVVERENYSIIRPLVFVTKDEILAYDSKNNIDYAIDKSNFSPKYTRNRYRKIVLPFLKKEDKNVHLKFLKYSEMLSKYDEYLEKEAIACLDKICDKDKNIDIEKFKKQGSLIQNKIITNLLKDYYEDDLILISDVHVNLIKNLIYSNRSNSSVYLPNSVVAIKSYSKFYLDVQTDQIDSYEIELVDYANLPNGKNIKVVDSSAVNDNNYCRLCNKDIVLPLRVRTRKSGDRMKVKGLNGSKKVKDIFIDSKIPVNKRDMWPVVVDSTDTVVWIPGLKKSKFDVSKNKKCDIILKYY